MSQTTIKEIVSLLTQMETDSAIPKNIKIKIQKAISSLNENEINISVKADRTLQELDDISEDPNIPTYTRMQIWNIVSLLEGL